MTSPLYKKFHQLNASLTNGNFRSAENLLHELHREDLPPAAQVLFDSLNKKFNLASDVLINFESAVTFPELEPERPDGLLSSYENRALLEGVSLVSCCMNRNDNLKKSLTSWLRLPVQEIVIVDWSSTTPVADTIADIADERVKIVRVDNETRWILTYAFNVGLRFASYKKIFKLDADIETQENFLEVNHFDRGEFIRGSWESAIAEDQVDQVYINGSYGCYKTDLLKIGFYNEHIRTYGWDDSDLYTRLSTKCGLKQRFLAFSSLSHIHQEQEERLKYQKIPRNMFINRVPATEFTNSCNKFTIALFDQWWPNFLQDYTISHAGENHWSCRRITEHRTIPNSVLKDARKYAVLENLFRTNPAWADKVYAAPWMADFIYEQYTAEIPFKETAALLLIENPANGYFDKGTSPYAVLKNIAKNRHDKELADNLQLYVFEGDNSRFELIFGDQKLILLGMEPSCFQSIKETQKDDENQKLFSNPDLTETTFRSTDKNELDRVLAVSLYDESNQERVEEYLECLKRNLQHFDAMAIFYEQSNRSMYKKATELIHSLDTGHKANVIWIRIENRPTFEEIFNCVDFIFPGAIVVTANADIAFDETVYEINSETIQDSFLVLSRQEIPEYSGGNGGHIMTHFGLPNAWSADAWVYKTPRKAAFKADFPVGTFHCDSFLNYHIGKSAYRVYNPCLSINNFHIHHEAFNSSEFKRLQLASEIAQTLSRETEYCDGEEPIRGIQWCRIKDVCKPERADQMIKWSNFIISIFIDSKGENIISALMIATLCLKLARQIEGSISVSLNIPCEIVNTQLGDLVFDALQAFGNRDLNIAITNPGEERPFVDGPETCHKASFGVRSLINTYLASFSGNSEFALFDTDISFEEVNGQKLIAFRPHISIYFDDPQANDLTTYLLLKSMKNEEYELFSNVIATLSQEHHSLRPFVDELRIAQQIGRPTPTNALLDEFWSTRREEKKKPFKVTYLTSVFKGADFFRGFLENIAASAIECNAEVILVDAASPDNEKEILDQFINEYPGLRDRFSYISLDHDPGLYNCWKLAIEQSSSEFVGNANLDDRRSPFQTAALLDVLSKKPALSGAATALRATKVKNAAWYSLLDNQYWFTDEASNRIEFESLYLSNENNEKYSKNIMHCMPVWKKSLHRKHGYFDEGRYGTSADWAFWLECTKNEEKFELLPLVLSMYFINETSHNRAHDTDGEKELMIIKDYLDSEQENFIQQ